MTDSEKIEAFDAIAIAFTNQWYDGRWTWWVSQPSGSSDTPRMTRREAIEDLVEWAKWKAKRQRPRRRLELLVVK